MVRDARRRRALHNEGLIPHPEEAATRPSRRMTPPNLKFTRGIAYARRGTRRSQDGFFSRGMAPADVAQFPARPLAGSTCLGHYRRRDRAGRAVAQSPDMADRGDGRRHAPAWTVDPDA